MKGTCFLASLAGGIQPAEKLYILPKLPDIRYLTAVMQRKASLKTMARDLGLSVSTISRVLNGKGRDFRISQETIDTVLEYADEIGYSPDLIAKGLQASKTYTIGLIIPDIANPFFALMAKHIEMTASRAGYSILLVDSGESTLKEKKQVKNMISRKVDGIIAAPVGVSFDHFTEITGQNIPLVLIDRFFEGMDVPYISSDNYQGAFKATELLIKNGHKRIGLIKGDDAIEIVKQRERGYLQALKKAGIRAGPGLITGNSFSIENGYTSTKRLLERDKIPTAIFAMNNLIGLGVLKALRECKMTIPGHVSLVVFDDQPYISYIDPPITTVKQNFERIGELAVEYLLSKIEKPDGYLPPVMVPTKIISRQSVRKVQ